MVGALSFFEGGGPRPPKPKKKPANAIGLAPASRAVSQRKAVGAVPSAPRRANKGVGAVPSAPRRNQGVGLVPNSSRKKKATTTKNTSTRTPVARNLTVPKAPRSEPPPPVNKQVAVDDPNAKVNTLTAVEPETPPEPMSLEDWYLQDSAYISAEAAAKAARDQALAGYGRDRDSTNRGYGDGLRNLGRRWEDQNNNGYADDDELEASTWDSSNPLGAYGQAYKNTQDDFTSRGLMDSSFFVDAMSDLDNSFDTQYGDMNSARQEALAELLAQEESSKSDYNSAIAAERANSAQRRALKYQL